MINSFARQLRELLTERSAPIAPGVFDGVSAKLTAAAGFRVAYMSGAAAAAAVTGLPDVGLVAEQLNSLFYRNCINYGLLALTVPDARELITEGDRVSLDTEAGRLVNQTTGTTAQAVPLPGFLREIVAAGGIFPQLEASGRLRPATEH